MGITLAGHHCYCPALIPAHQVPCLNLSRPRTCQTADNRSKQSTALQRSIRTSTNGHRGEEHEKTCLNRLGKSASYEVFVLPFKELVTLARFGCRIAKCFVPATAGRETSSLKEGIY